MVYDKQKEKEKEKEKEEDSSNYHPKPLFYRNRMLQPPLLLLSKVDEQVMNIELQATDSSGSSHYDEEEAEEHYFVDDSLSRKGGTPLDENNPEKEPPLLLLLLLQACIEFCRFSLRQKLGLLVGILPVCMFGLEMIPERCHVCLEGIRLDSYFLAAATCGGFGALLFGTSSMDSYWLARFLGGATSALGSLFMMWMLLQTIPSDSLVIVGILLGAIIGAMPGILVYFLIKIVSDECYVSDIRDYEDLVPLTRLQLSYD